MHQYYIAACQEFKISYRVLSLWDDNWVNRVQDSGCDAFLIWPSSSSTEIKTLFDMRLYFLEKDMKRLIFPTWKECWLTEYKPRLRDWLQIHGIPHPQTWVFYDRDQGLEFCRNSPLPIVVKTATGAAGSGVRIVRTRNALIKVADQFFKGGVRVRSAEPWDKQRGYLFLQEFLPDVDEWRMVRVGDSFFGHPKVKAENGMHSGSGKCAWEDPSPELLTLLKDVTDIGSFRSMNVDVFVTAEKRLYVNECQTTFGCAVATTQMKVNGAAGRYVYIDGTGWQFEQGEYCSNHLCNLRVEWVLGMLKRGAVV